ncbi:hypothetical protein [Lacinutrix sp.]|uniref:hypothetical protein n=1 Tax=Lacinutrix sp. TaxID=1937692 RepID=UPI0025BE0661|nr:hypothetical protein [Lacinutrix sp.]
MQPQQKSIWSLVAGIAFLGIGSYRIYNHFFSDSISYGNFRLILAVAFIGYGAYRIYNYLSAE